MIEFFKKYYAIGLVVLGARGAALARRHPVSAQTTRFSALRDALIWTGVLLSCWLQLTRHPVFPSGNMAKTDCGETKLYTRLLLECNNCRLRSKRYSSAGISRIMVQVVKNFGLHSVYHADSLEAFSLDSRRIFSLLVSSWRIVLFRFWSSSGSIVSG